MAYEYIITHPFLNVDSNPWPIIPGTQGIASFKYPTVASQRDAVEFPEQCPTFVLGF